MSLNLLFNLNFAVLFQGSTGLPLCMPIPFSLNWVSWRDLFSCLRQRHSPLRALLIYQHSCPTAPFGALLLWWQLLSYYPNNETLSQKEKKKKGDLRDVNFNSISMSIFPSKFCGSFVVVFRIWKHCFCFRTLLQLTEDGYEILAPIHTLLNTNL